MGWLNLNPAGQPVPQADTTRRSACPQADTPQSSTNPSGLGHFNLVKCMHPMKGNRANLNKRIRLG